MRYFNIAFFVWLAVIGSPAVAYDCSELVNSVYVQKNCTTQKNRDYCYIVSDTRAGGRQCNQTQTKTHKRSYLYWQTSGFL